MLGASETVGRESELFSSIDRKNKIYSHKSITIQTNFDFPATAYTPPPLSESHFAAMHISLGVEVRKLVENLMLDNYGPPGAIIDQNMRMLHFYGQAGLYIQPSAGVASLNLLKMIRQELLPECRSAAYQAIKELENELTTEREYLQSTIEELEEANATLQSTNEEVQSINEAFQSTNEELETSKEELQSTNEELATIIEEHQNRNQALNIVNNDMKNLLAYINFVIVMLDKDLRIRQFTSAAKPLMNLIDADIGHPIGNLQPSVHINNPEKEIQQVIRTIMPRSIEAQDRDGHWRMLRFCPYQTQDGRIDGAVITCFDIDHNKKTEQLQQQLAREQRVAAVARDSNDAVAGHFLAWNKRTTDMYGYNEEEAPQLDTNTLTPEIAREEVHMLFERLRHGETAPPCESWRRAKEGRIIKV